MTLCTHGIFTRLLRPGVACASKMGEGDRRARFVAASSRRRVRVLGPRDLHLLLRLARLELPPAAVSCIIIAAGIRIIIAAEIRIIIAAVTCIIIVEEPIETNFSRPSYRAVLLPGTCPERPQDAPGGRKKEFSSIQF